MTDEHYSYELNVERTDGGYIARLYDADSPLRGFGTTPLEAVRALCETIRQWPIGGSERWLNTSAGVAVARQFVPSFEPGKPGASS